MLNDRAEPSTPATAAAKPALASLIPPAALNRWPLLVGFAALAVPTLVSLGNGTWTKEAGAHGPIVLATGAWLIWRNAAVMRQLAAPGSQVLGWLAFLASLGLYVFGRTFDFITFEAMGLFGVGLSMLYVLFGGRALLKTWFPFFYLAFLIPPPNWLMDRLTAPLKQFVSSAATGALYLTGLPIEREGVTIHVAQYSLLVEDACSGMNSLVGLIAISLFYIYLLRGSSVRYSAVLTLFVVPIAVLGNILRVMTLILLTYFAGDEVAQGFIHGLAGLFLFAVDLLLVFGVDVVLARFLPKSWRPQ
ncbi:exosortase V [Phenylobacterium sp.]|uniref:exosortase V n=1 Tax=Phenylobacterium sp. TaxID=1871053 RepID=UPI00121CDCAF|nr:exosortase V [Phenylobacterium sp.]THD65111.1 MAG: exosortase [Phenylobacterium sp.]